MVDIRIECHRIPQRDIKQTRILIYSSNENQGRLSTTTSTTAPRDSVSQCRTATVAAVQPARQWGRSLTTAGSQKGQQQQQDNAIHTDQQKLVGGFNSALGPPSALSRQRK